MIDPLVVRIHQHVAGLDVAVVDPPSVQVCQGRGHLQPVHHELVQGVGGVVFSAHPQLVVKVATWLGEIEMMKCIEGCGCNA